jgi:hypothetical protein
VVEFFQELFVFVQKNLAVFVSVVGGFVAISWALWNYILSRTHVPRLQVEVKADIVERDDRRYLLATIQVKNLGQSIIRLPAPSENGAGPRGSSLLVAPLAKRDVASSGIENEWEDVRPREEFGAEEEDIHSFEVLVHHGSIEPGLSLNEQKLIRLPERHCDAFWVRLRILAYNKSWSAVAIVAPKARQDAGES